ncbi:hypothetical protein PFBG_03285 [Plasmodium falciparum 7G8]|uniref:Uncharacterized protein n=1 Tax=Plasmodium falciparum (isolate 7G8) TaxID=57266 RepID=W7F5F5_PLAF8|nr:hypothetical protein PFBG_03285 [Plasmodium falciparum 7G8]
MNYYNILLYNNTFNIFLSNKYYFCILKK